ncbi:MAG: sortase [Bacilli bacterium]|nr:sortase [Bacilli bacterium]
MITSLILYQMYFVFNNKIDALAFKESIPNHHNYSSNNNYLSINNTISINNKKYQLSNQFNNQSLTNGFAIMEISKPINQKGQTIIGTHREAFGKIINNIKLNDIILINYNTKNYYYQAYNIKIIKDDEYNKFYLEDTNNNIITLFTCYPINSKEKPTQRLVIELKLIK